jgi:hypothetical protein
MQFFFGHNCAYSVSSQVEAEERMAMPIHTRRVYLKKVACSWALVWHCNPSFIPDLSVAVNPMTLRPLDGTVVATLFVDKKSAFQLQDQLCPILIEVRYAW